MNNEPLEREPIDRVQTRLEALLKANAAPRCGARSNRDSPDESQTGINVRVFPALLQDRREVLTAASTSDNPNAWSRV